MGAVSLRGVENWAAGDQSGFASAAHAFTAKVPGPLAQLHDVQSAVRNRRRVVLQQVLPARGL
ncbi:hypothetical protein SODG_001935 [Sodalis praecaptivus]